MVHALRRACGWLAANGRIIDLHPTASPARLMIGTASDAHVAGDLVDMTDGCGPAGRHAHADAALASAVSERWLVLEGRRDVTFWHQSDTLAEMLEHVSAEWRDAHFTTVTLERAAALVGAHPRGRVLLQEEISISRLRPGAQAV